MINKEEKKFFCEDCGVYHTEICEVTKEESDSLRFLNSRIKTANDIIEAGQANEKVIKAAIDVISDNQYAAGLWWDEISIKYGVDMEGPEKFLDFDRNVVYYTKKEDMK